VVTSLQQRARYAKPGFKPIEEWRAEISRKIAAQLEYADPPHAAAPH
jgi:hypothetical protein